MIIDTHCHAGLHKYEPIESLLYHMRETEVEKAVLIQHGGEFDNSYHIECINKFPNCFASAMLVSPDDEGDSIHKWAEQGIVGIRLGASSRAQTSNPLAHWSTANQLDLVVSALGSPETFLSEEFAEVLQRYPNLHIIIEHFAGVTNGAPETVKLFTKVLELAEHEQLSIKLPGFGEFCALPYPFESVPQFADMTLEAFSPQRIMWGSDYPPVTTREGYKHSLEFPMKHLSRLSEDELGWIFGKSAFESWRFT
ncbi:MAG: amidohydrolase family protein [Candidatus Latescibacterota bacterium]|nr:amidohydrolase family protein [Candidatus Latescibacterota bacterium]